MGIDTFINSLNRQMTPQLQTHMKNVYSCVALSTLSAAAGALIHLFTDILAGGFLSGIGSIGLMLALMSTPPDGKNNKLRLGYLLGFAFLSGLGLGPLLDRVISINPAIIPTALFSTCLVFTCFTFASMLNRTQMFMHLGGTLMSLMTVMMVGGILNIFMGSYILFQLHVYLGLIVGCLFILYDTQLILEKHRGGDRDFIMHSIMLFLDLIQVFRYLLVILAEKENRDKKK